jgi:hypothetical protein
MIRESPVWLGLDQGGLCAPLGMVRAPQVSLGLDQGAAGVAEA